MSRGQSQPSVQPSVNLPIYGNFQRYYNIRNPKSKSVISPCRLDPDHHHEHRQGDEGHDQDHNDTLSASHHHPDLLPDSRIPPILDFLSKEAKHASERAVEINRVLDLGCNVAKVSIQLAHILRPCPELVLGVDIDPSLVKQANVSASKIWSLSKPPSLPTPSSENMASLGASGKSDSDGLLPPDLFHFPSCFPTIFGHLPPPPPKLLGTEVDPSISQGQPPRKKRRKSLTEPVQLQTKSSQSHPPSPATSLADVKSSLRFVSAEWVNADVQLGKLRLWNRREGLKGKKSINRDGKGSGLGGGEVEGGGAEEGKIPDSDSFSIFEPNFQDLEIISREDRIGYDLTLCLSLTKWIHIHQGDDGILKLFSRIFSTLRPRGYLVVEVQPWSSYQQVRGMGKEIRSKMSSLRFSPEQDFEWILCQVNGFISRGRIGYGQGMGFKRELHVYQKPDETGGSPSQEVAVDVANSQASNPREEQPGTKAFSIPWVKREKL
ncbi:Bin3-domain-containing protein [Violaceomyces palustris]|uniref:Bin3-domain-containing protein n=1 Tax=Violaceomyces palustris TaxID=1673888 RepID=A0ACD0NZK7_9BASI|nr:Bin3-domain-containing protein [Violaceomyces palustris]